MKIIPVLFLSCLFYCSSAQTASGPLSGPTTICVGDSITLHCNFFAISGWSITYPTDSVVVEFGIGTSPSCSNVIIHGIAPGIARILCYNTLEEYDTITETVSVCAAGVVSPTFGKSSGQAVTVFPNPNNGTFTVSISSANDDEARIVITNMVGERVKEFTVSTNKPVPIAIGMRLTEPAGVYFMSVTTAGGRYVTKVIVE